MKSRVLIVDDHAAVREGLRRSLEANDIEIVGEAGNGAEALSVARRVHPDVVLLDVSLPDIDGVEVTRRVLSENPAPRVVMLTMLGDRETICAAMKAGASGYLVKDCTTTEIVAMIEGVLGEDRSLPASVSIPMFPEASCVDQPLLSAREREVLQLVAEGASTAEVATKLYISAKTAKNHFANIYDKLQANDRTQAVLQGLRMGIIRLR